MRVEECAGMLRRITRRQRGGAAIWKRPER